MQSIMFNNRYRLTKSVLERIKTNSRRFVKCPHTYKGQYVAGFHVYKNASGFFQVVPYDEEEHDFETFIRPRYKIGEVVAVAQSYLDIAEELEDCNNASCAGEYEKRLEKASHYSGYLYHPGFTNKMFISAEEMIHYIKITDVRVERLQEISDDDCLKEGIVKMLTNAEYYTYSFFDEKKSVWIDHSTPREAFADLINRTCGKGTWEENPFVWVYEFKLMR